MKEKFEDLQMFYRSSNINEDEDSNKPCVIPSSHFLKIMWDMFVLGLLLTVCTIIPWRLAFDGESHGWEIAYYVIDGIFFIDLVMTFFTTIPSETGLGEIDDKAAIAEEYLKGWFLIDFLSIVPFDTIIRFVSQSGDEGEPANFNTLIRTVKLTKIYKLIRLMRLMKLFKVLKNKENINSQFS
jgi:hypothetical protein